MLPLPAYPMLISPGTGSTPPPTGTAILWDDNNALNWDDGNEMDFDG